ncbi:MAG: penicillin-binding transpeptidase domain-containing protein [Candidatus Aminicenantales bacterium]
MASWVGPEMIWRRLPQLGFQSLEQSSDFYGVGLTLGNGEVTLLELTRAYAALARGGVYQPERAILGVSTNESIPPRRVRVFSPQVAYIITHILADADARVPSFGYLTPLSFPFPVAVKTGTSEDFRDNWTVGYTFRYTIGVWVGNFNGRPMGNISGIAGSGHLFHDIMLLLHSKEPPPPFPEPEGIIKLTICAESGELTSGLCPDTTGEIFIRGTKPRTTCSEHGKGLTAPPGLTAKKNFQKKIVYLLLSDPAQKLFFPKTAILFLSTQFFA